jgi:cell division protein FtsW
MAKRVGVDKWLFFTTLCWWWWAGHGLLRLRRHGAGALRLALHLSRRQALWALLGVIAMVVLMRVDYRRYNSKKFIYPADGHHTAAAAGRSLSCPARTPRIAGFASALLHLSAFGDRQAGAVHLPGVVSAYAAHAMRDWKHTLLRLCFPALVFIG